MPAETDREEILDLTSRMATGDETAFRAFHDLYFDRLLRYLLVLTRGDEDSARDALQNVFLRVVRHIKPFRDETIFWSWLTVLARSTVIDAGRKQRRYWSFLQLFASSGVSVQPTNAESADHRLLGLLDESIESLGESERALLTSKYLEGNSVGEIASALGESEKAIESRLGRVRRKLREIILNRLKHEK